MRVRIPEDAQGWLGRKEKGQWGFRNRLGIEWAGAAARESLAGEGLILPELPPCSAVMLEVLR